MLGVWKDSGWGRQSIAPWLGSAGGLCLLPPHLGLSQEMSPLHLHDFSIQPQGNRDEGPENPTQAHEDAKVRPMLLWTLRLKKEEDVACLDLELTFSGQQMLLGQGLCKLQGEMPGEMTPLEVKLSYLIAETLGSAVPRGEQPQGVPSQCRTATLGFSSTH